MGEFKPVEMESIQQTENSNEDIAEQDHLETGNSEIVPSESDGSVANEKLDVEEPVVEYSPIDEDGLRNDNTDSPVAEQEHFETDSDACVYTETEPVALVGSMPEDRNTEIDSFEKPDMHVAIETSDENSKIDEMTLVAENDKDLTDSSDGTVNELLENCEVSIHVTPPNGNVGNETEDDHVDLKEGRNIQEKVSEDLCQNNSSSEVSLTTGTTKDTEGDEIDDSQRNVDSDSKLLENESTQDGCGNASLNLEKVDDGENTNMTYKCLDDSMEPQLEQYSPRFDGGEAVVTHKHFVKVADEGIVSAEIGKSSDHEQSEVVVEKMATAETLELNEEKQGDDSSSADIISSNDETLERKINVDEKDPGTVSEPAADVEQAEVVEKEECGETAVDDAIVLQRVEAGQLYFAWINMINIVSVSATVQ